MKRKIALILVLALALLAFTACGSNGEQEGNGGEEMTVLKIGASPVPHAEILAIVKPMLAEQGIDLQVTEYTDYIIPNTAVESRDLDGNFFQHIPYLENFNKENGTHLVNAVAVHYEPYGLYAGKTISIEALKEGATIAIPNDPTNGARALLLLQQEGIIKLKDGVGLAATANDIVENPLKVKIYEAEAAAVARTLEDVDMAVINGNYALEIGLYGENAVALEDESSAGATVFPNILAVYEGDESRPEIQALVKALNSDEVRNYIESTYKGSVVPVF